MELYVWPSKWGMSSFDPESLTVMAYLRFGSSPVQINVVSSPWYSPCGALPCLEHSNNQIFNLNNILNYLRKENYGMEYDLQDMEVISMKALIHSLELYLIPGLEHFWWLNTSSFLKIIRPSYGASIGLPLNLFWPNRMRNKYHNKLMNILLYNREKVSDQEMKNVLYENTTRCITALSNMLGDQEFFIANRPTAVDAIVYGRLWSIMNAPVDTNDEIVRHLNRCDKLKKYLININERYFSDITTEGSFRATLPPEIATSSGDKNRETSCATPDKSSPVDHTLRNTLLFVSAAVGVSLVYGVMNGIIEINMDAVMDILNGSDHQPPIHLTSESKNYLIRPREDFE